MKRIVATVLVLSVWCAMHGQANGIELVSVAIDGTAGSHHSYGASMDEAGRVISFDSSASDLIVGGDTGTHDAFVRDIQSGQTVRLRGNVGGEFLHCNEPRMAPDGRSVIFRGWQAWRSMIVTSDTLWRADLGTWSVDCIFPSVSRNYRYAPGSAPALSYNNRYIAFSTRASYLGHPDYNPNLDIYVRDCVTGGYEWISAPFAYGSWGEGCLAPDISADGRFVVFQSDFNLIVPGDVNGSEDIFLHDREAGTTTLISRLPVSHAAAGESIRPTISADGRFIAFESTANFSLDRRAWRPYLEIFVYDRILQTFSRLVRTQEFYDTGGFPVLDPKISSDGSTVVFTSDFPHVPEDSNDSRDVFTVDVKTKVIRRISVAADGGDPDGPSGYTAISADGKTITFGSLASNLVANDDNHTHDVFVYRE